MKLKNISETVNKDELFKKVRNGGKIKALSFCAARARTAYPFGVELSRKRTLSLSACLARALRSFRPVTGRHGTAQCRRVQIAYRKPSCSAIKLNMQQQTVPKTCRSQTLRSDGWVTRTRAEQRRLRREDRVLG